jgi:hypothetical protein
MTTLFIKFTECNNFLVACFSTKNESFRNQNQIVFPHADETFILYLLAINRLNIDICFHVEITVLFK